MNTPTDCPCGSGANYAQCCAPFHRGEKTPLTAEALMRSRFTAFYLHNEAYLLATWDNSQRPAAIDFTAEKTAWLKLNIISTKKGGIKDHKATVTFNAHYLLNGEEWVMHETSRFNKNDNRWFYLDGVVNYFTAANQPMVQNRNAPCSCGSGKNFKICCGIRSNT